MKMMNRLIIGFSFLVSTLSFANSDSCDALLNKTTKTRINSFDVREHVMPSSIRQIGLRPMVLRGSEIGESASYTYANIGFSNNFILNIHFPDSKWGITKFTSVLKTYFENEADQKTLKTPLVKALLDLQKELNSNLFVRIQAGIEASRVESLSFVHTYGATNDSRWLDLKILTIPKDLQYESFNPQINTRLSRLEMELNIQESTLKLTKSHVVARPNENVLIADSNSSQEYVLIAGLNFKSTITEISASSLTSELFFGEKADKDVQQNLDHMVNVIRQIFPKNKIILKTLDQKKFQYNGIHRRWDESKI